MITHGIIKGYGYRGDPLYTIVENLLKEPALKPSPEPKEVWEDRTKFWNKPKEKRQSPVCRRGGAIYKEKWHNAT